jgi:DNA-binding NtrC family response regulator
VLIQGATGSGKWHAARQLAHWRRAQPPVIWNDSAACPELPEGATLLIRWLDAWPEAAWRNLAALADERPDLAMVATVRTDRLPPGGLERLTTDTLRGAVAIDLPTLAARSDLVALAESLARQLGIADGKLKERLQHDLLTDHFPHNLHDLKTRLATANAASPGQHPERKAYLQARDRHQAQQLLDRAWQAIASLDFGTDRLQLDEALDAIRLAVVQRSLAEGRSQKDAGEQLGLSQQTVSAILKTELSPYLYPAEREHAD